MSELPWENKKIADIMSSAGDEAKISDSNDSDKKKSVNPPIPDILASAFDDVPMEEAEIEVNGPVSGVESIPMPKTDASPFGDLPDLSALGSNQNIEPNSEPKESRSSAALPPFMNGPNALESPKSKEEVVSAVSAGSKPLFDPESPDIKGNFLSDIIKKSGTASKKRSPPPLFEPVMPFDENEVTDDDIVSSSPLLPESGNESVSFPPDNGLSDVNPLKVTSVDEVNPDNSVNPFESGPTAGANPFESARVDGVNPFKSSPAAGANPFESARVDGVNPFKSSPADGVNPFESGPADGVNSFESNPAGGVNPFESSPANGVNPFEPNPAGGINPFESSPGTGNNTLGNAPPAGANPFESTFQETSASASKDSSGSKGSIKTGINVDVLKKNVEGISVVARDFIKSLTKGKSLIERMEDLREDSTSADIGSKSAVSPSPDRSSPFDNESDNPFVNSQADPFSAPLEDAKGSLGDQLQDNPFAADMNTEVSEDIRQVTPIDNPVMEMKEEYLVGEDISNENAAGDFTSNSASDESTDLPDTDSGLVGIIPVGDSADKDDLNDAVIDSNDLSAKVETSPNTELSKNVLSGELRDMKADAYRRFDGFEGDITGLKENIRDMDTQFDSIRAEVGNFSDKVSEIDQTFSSLIKSNEEVLSQDKDKFDGLEGKISSVETRADNFESTLAVLQSDNASIRSDLSRIEDNVSELVSSYTALLAQLHESLQENESNFSRIDSMSARLDEIGSKIGTIEKSHEDAKSTSMEFSRSISGLVDNLGTISSEFLEFKQESEKKNVAMVEKIDSVTEYVESELKKVGAKSYKGFGQNVHLSNIVKNSSNMKLCMEWLEFLMELVGRNNLPDILSYYEELGWITEKVRMELLHYAEGIDFYMEKPDWKLTPDDHVKSIWFIESLAGMKVDKNRLSVIERDIEKVKKGSEIYGI